METPLLLDLLFSRGDTTHFLVAPKVKRFRVFTPDGSTKVKDTVSPAPGLSVTGITCMK